MLSFLPKKMLQIVFSFLFLVAVGLLTTTSAHAASAYTNMYTQSNVDTTVPDTLHNRVQVAFIELLAGAGCQLAGIDVTRPDRKCLQVNSVTGTIGYAKTSSMGVMGILGNAITSLYTNMPAHTGDYIAYLHNNFGFAKPALAAGEGYTSLAPMMGIWVTIRNVAYLMIVLVFIFIGFAIMLRVKIDPRTVMTIENQIPKIIIGLILITLSFAIAGFLIDLMYISIYLLYQVYAAMPLTNHSLTPAVFQSNTPLGIVTGGYISPLQNPFQSIPALGSPYIAMVVSLANPLADFMKNILNIPAPNYGWSSFLGPLSGGAGTPLNSLQAGSPVGLIIDIVSLMLTIKVLGLVFSALNSVPFGGLIGIGVSAATGGWIYTFFEKTLRDLAPNVIAFFIVYIAIIIAMMRLLFGLLTAWVSILFSIALAPFQIFLGLIPGAKGGFGDWLKGLVANLMAFPVTAGIFLLGSALIQVFSQANSNAFFVPPMLGGGSVPVGALLGIIVLFAASQGPQMAKDMLQVKDDKYAGAFGTMMGGATQMVYKTARGTHAAFGKIPTPGARGGLTAAWNVMG